MRGVNGDGNQDGLSSPAEWIEPVWKVKANFDSAWINPGNLKGGEKCN